jgi:hypothetical protein
MNHLALYVKFNNLQGQTDESTCSLCDKGKFNNLQGRTDESACTPCGQGKFNSIPGQSDCVACNKGKYTVLEGQLACLNCPRPRNCLGGNKCLPPWDGASCSKCLQTKTVKYYLADAKTCVKCPDSNGDITMGIFICVFIPLICFGLYKIMAEKHETDEELRKKMIVEQQNRRQSRVISSAQKLAKVRQSNGATRRSSPAVTATILAKHSLNLSFIFPLLQLFHLPPEIRDLLARFLSIITIDITGMVSSPECEWGFVSTFEKYLIKMICPIIFFVMFVIWYRLTPFYVRKICMREKSKGISVGANELKYKQGLKIRNMQNRILAVGVLLWLTVLYPLTLYHTLSAIDCTTHTSDDGAILAVTLDMDPDIACNFNITYLKLFLVCIFCIIVYGIVSLGYVMYHIGVIPWLSIPRWSDYHNCGNIRRSFKKHPCDDCDLCDQRQRYAWLFRRYQSNYFYWEYVAMIHKIAIMMISLFLSNRLQFSLPILLGVNCILFILICIFQPYLTDEEYLIVYELGRDLALPLIKRKRCSKKGCGANNALDAILYLGEIFVIIAAIIMEELGRPLMNEALKSSYENRNNATQVTTMDVLVRSNYPAANTVANILEVIGITIYVLGFVTMLKTLFLFLASKCKRKASKKKKQENKKLDIEMTTANPMNKGGKVRWVPILVTHSFVFEFKKVLKKCNRI